MENIKPLYHYTTQTGLLGILQNKKLWMTDILYLNDSSEFKHCIDLVKLELESRKNLFGKGFSLFPKWEKMTIEEKKFHVYDDLEDILYLIHTDLDINLYVFSLSQEKDDLSQWRGYCSKGVGFCIEFDTEKILSITGEKKYTFQKCIYKQNEKMNLIKTRFDNLESLFELKSDDIDRKLDLKDKKLSELSDGDKIELLYYINILDISSQTKDESFEDEDEYRIVRQFRSDKIMYREGTSMIVPYIEESLLDEDGRLPISKIIVGPSPHPELSKRSVNRLLKSCGYDIEVELSKIPYRLW